MTCLSWNGRLLSAGGRDQEIRHLDIRVPSSNGEDFRRRNSSSSLGSFRFHTHEVCGLEWDPSGRFLASGGNDNLLCIWDIRRTSSTSTGTASRGESEAVRSPLMRRNSIQDSVREISKPLLVWRDHMAAVKALDWCPHRSGYLATGGGTLDKRLMLWDVKTGTRLAMIDTGSQICNMKWSPFSQGATLSSSQKQQHVGGIFGEMELLTTHGFTQNQLILWRVAPQCPRDAKETVFYHSTDYLDDNHLSLCQRLIPLATIKGHTQRVVHMDINPRSGLVTTGSGDETLRFWNIFGKKK